MVCNEDCFNCIYDDCVWDEGEARREYWRKCRQNYTEEEKERRRAVNRKWYEANAEKVREYQRRYYQAHKESHDARTNAWRLANPEKIKEYRRRYREKLKAKKLEQVAEGLR